LVIQPLKDNVLVLDYCNVEVAGRKLSDINYLHATDSIFKFHGFKKSDIDHNPWNFTVQFNRELLNHEFAENSGFDAIFPFEIDPSFHLKDLRIGVDYGRLYEVSVNGSGVELKEDWHYFDHSIDVYRIPASILKHGINTIRLSIHPMHVLAEMERVFVMGKFDLAPAQKGFMITEGDDYRLGSWADQGWMFYPESMSYQKSFMLEEPGPVKISLGEWKGTVAAVKVNGSQAGIIGWKPYELDIGELVKKGNNQVEVIVYGSPFNLLGPHYDGPPGGIATPWSWNWSPQHQPSGSKYFFIDYGLMSDYDILVAR
jgi:hypothetical protein